MRRGAEQDLHREKMQEAKDKAQDEMMVMEFDRIGREIEMSVQHSDLQRFQDKIKADMEAMKKEMQESMRVEVRGFKEIMATAIGKVMQQMKDINESTEEQLELVDKRMDTIQSEMGDAVIMLERKGEAVARKIAAEVVAVSEKQAEAKMVQLQKVVQKAEQALVKIEEKHEAMVIQQQKQAELGNGNIAAIEDQLIALLKDGGFEARVNAWCDPLLDALEKRLSEPIQRLG